MASPHERPYLDPADADMPPSELLVMDILAGVDPDALRVDDGIAKVMAEAPVEGRLGPSASSREERHEAGYEAYEQATRRRIAGGDTLDEETVSLYRKAADDLLVVGAWQGSGDRPRNPFDMLTRATCLGWQAEGTAPGVLYDDTYGSHIDMRSHLQELADKELVEANEILLGNDPAIKALAGEMTDTTIAVIADAAVEAADEAGTAEHIEVRGIGGVDEETSERLVAGGQEALARFTVGHAMETEHGGKFTAIMAEKEATAVHRLPVAA